MWSVPLSVCPLGLYCTLEVDSFGYFVNKAKTRVYRDTAEPNWNEVRPHFPANEVLRPRAVTLRASLPASVPTAVPGISRGSRRARRFYLRVPENSPAHTHPSSPHHQ